MKRLILAALLAASAFAVAAPGGEQPLTMAYSGGQISSIVEQQSPNYFEPPCSNGTGPTVYELTGAMASAATDTITLPNHGLAYTWRVTFRSLTGGSGFVLNQPYRVMNTVTANTFQVGNSFGGPAINITADYTDMSVRTGCDSATWVTNPLRFAPDHCAWDVDDNFSIEGFGYVDGGTTATGVLCTIADAGTLGGSDHMLTATVYAPNNQLAVTLENDQGWSTTLPAVVNGNGYKWDTCVVDHTPGPYPVIPDSNGGTGIPVRYTLRMTATGNRVRSVSAFLKAILVGSSEYWARKAAGCV